MDDMSRPHFCGCAQAALVACLTLTAGTCGNGLFAPGLALDANADGGTSIDAADVARLVADGHAADGVSQNTDGRATDVVPLDADAPVLPVADAYPDQKLSDGTSDGIAARPSITAKVDSPGGTIPLGDATLVVLRGTFPQETFVTLTLISDDGTLADHPGAIGPIFSISKTDALGNDVTLQQPMIFNLDFTSANSSIPAQRITLAYLNTQSNPNLWIPIVPDSSHDAGADVLTGIVVDFSGTRLFAPVESCLSGEACPDPEICGGGSCQ
jgi:hypothetical protein